VATFRANDAVEHCRDESSGFLEKWRAGATVAEANFRANKAVEDGFGFVPEKCLAMTVYGNPMLRRAHLRAPLV